MKNTLKNGTKQPRKVSPQRAPSRGTPARTIGLDLGFERSAYCELNRLGRTDAELLSPVNPLGTRWPRRRTWCEARCGCVDSPMRHGSS